MENKEYYQKVEKLNEQLVNLTLSLQNEVKELKEDTLVNAQHINVLKQKNLKNLNIVNAKLKEHIDNTDDLAQNLANTAIQKENNDYTYFLKSLLESDFKALQNEMLENTKREILNHQSSNSYHTKNSLNLTTLCNVLSIISFIAIIVITVKYRLFL
ncbi:hypothetical protein [Helicobacter sp. MIT 14-3879]|uniref:hypothetical protein n=1 Tax=Helicobacter sp. MIT 14-3879 TaxID=2040649 RepID=UPI000E1F749E|nr:hypothetical protein [Helicobacter sp. MIT 14-3879]RDU61492.1 hypothetical protein CQA44_08775 [Helicobacter sp. MIT 14-3879]